MRGRYCNDEARRVVAPYARGILIPPTHPFLYRGQSPLCPPDPAWCGQRIQWGPRQSRRLCWGEEKPQSERAFAFQAEARDTAQATTM